MGHFINNIWLEPVFQSIIGWVITSLLSLILLVISAAVFLAKGWVKQYFQGQKDKEKRQQQFNEGIKNKLNDFESSNKEVLAQNKKMVTQTREVLAQNREVLTDVMECVRGVLNREEEWLNQSHTVHEHTRKIGTLEKNVEEVKSDIKQLKNTG